jgi:choline dehydrogenase-like flavoprotein
MTGSLITGGKLPKFLKTQVLIIGSGPGAATAAMVLAEAGKEVVVLEEGAYVPAENMTQREQAMMGLLFQEGGTRTTADQGMTILHGGVVGGGSVVNHLICFRTPDRLLELWARDGIDDLEPASMKRRFDRIWEILNVAPIQPEQLNRNNALLREGALALGWEGGCFERNAWNCVGSGFCTIGCAYNAKQSAALTMLPLACKAGATVYSQARVQKILHNQSRASGVEGVVLDEKRQPVRNFSVSAETVIVAGGAIRTPALLLYSGVPDPGGQIGKNLYLHPGTPIIAHFPGQNVDPTVGILQGYHISQFSWPLAGHETDVLLEGISGPPGVASVVIPGLGDAHQQQLAFLKEAAITGVLVRDHHPGHIEARKDGKPVVHWSLHPEDALRMREGQKRTAEAYFAAGAARCLTGHVQPTLLGSLKDLSRLDTARYQAGDLGMISYHQMGSCRMGGSREKSATNPDGRLWGLENVYVADSSLFPTASGVNPQISVYGMSMRVASRLAAR